MSNRNVLKWIIGVICVVLLAGYSPHPVLAADTTVIVKEATWDIGGGESYEGARARAKLKAEQDAAEEAGVYIESYARTQNYQLTADEVKTMAVAVLQVQVLDEEQRKTGKTSAAAWIKIQATVANAAIDTLRDRLKAKDNHDQLQQALAETARLQKILDEQNKQLAGLQQQLNQNQDQETRSQTLAAINANDRTTQALEVLREAHRYVIFLDYPQAESALNKALALRPDLAEAYLTRGDLYLAKKDYSQAVTAYRQATRYASGMKDAWFGLAMALAYQGSYTEAAQTFSYSVDYHPEALSGVSTNLEPYQDNGRWGFRRADGTMVTPAKFDSVDKFYDGLAQVTFDNQVGYVTSTEDGALLLAVNKQCQPWVFSSGRARVKLGDRYGYIDTSGQMVIEPRFKEAFAFQPEGASVEIGDKWGLIDRTGRVIIQPQSDGPLNFNEGLSVINQEFQYGYIDARGQIVIPLQFEFAWHFSEGLAVAKLNGKFGYIDRTGQFVISPQYAEAESFQDGKAKVALSSGFGYIDQTGKVVIPPRYYIASRFEDGLALVHPDDKNRPFWINRNGEQVPFQKREHVKVPPELAPFEINGKYGYQNAQQQVVIPALFEQAGNFRDGLAAVKLHGKWGYIDAKGQFVIAPQYYNARRFSEGLAVVMNSENKYIFIDRQGQQVFADQFELAYSFSEGMARVGQKTGVDGTLKFGFINHAGELVIPCQYNMTSGGFSEGLAAVLIEQEAWIDKQGNVIQQEQ